MDNEFKNDMNRPKMINIYKVTKHFDSELNKNEILSKKDLATQQVIKKLNQKEKIIANSKNDDIFLNKINLDAVYAKFILSAKRGDKDKFLEILKDILSTKKNINHQDTNGFTALHYACDEGNFKIVEILINAHCRVNIKNNHKQTPLHLSAIRGYFDISRKLIQSGAQLNVEDLDKNTPLHYLCLNNHIELIKFFLTKNPKIGNKNNYGKTPRDLASNQEIKNILDNYINKNISKGNRTICSNSNMKKAKIEPGQNKYKKLIEKYIFLI